MMKIEEIAAIAKEAGKIILDAGHSAVHEKAGHFNFVTDTDVSVQESLKAALLSRSPLCRFFSEEQENEPLTGAPTFVIDPIDGTINFMRGRHTSAISIGYLENKRPMMAVVHDPYRGETFTAVRGQGAFLNGRPIHVSSFPLEKAVTAFGTSPYDAELAEASMRAAKLFLMRGGDLRRSGSAALDLCDVACGRCDVFFELRLRPWDVAAGALIVEEAGGHFLSLGHEAPYFDEACGMMACNDACLEGATLILQEVL